MSNDDSRGNESPDRRNASTTRITDGGTQPIERRLEAIDYLTRRLLADVQDATGIDPSPDTRREVVRRLREIRAETSRVGLLLIGPEAAIPYRPADEPDPEFEFAIVDPESALVPSDTAHVIGDHQETDETPADTNTTQLPDDDHNQTTDDHEQTPDDTDCDQDRGDRDE